MLIPHPSSRVLSFKIPLLLPKVLLAGSVVVLLVSGYFVYSYNRLQAEASELKVFKDISTVQEERIKKLEKEADAVESKLGELNNLDKQIREMVGLETEGTDNRRAEAPSRGGTRTRAIVEPRGSGIISRDVSDGLTNRPKASEPQSEQPDKLDSLEKRLQELDKELATKKELLNQLKTDVQARLSFLKAYPSGWPLQGRITSTFGYRGSPFGRSSTEFHDGLDIANSYGTTIHAAGAGTVVSASWESGYGQMITINHGYGYRTSYAHCSAMLVQPGDKVSRGDPIGKVGSTGRSTGPHCHFMVTFNGALVNPREVLK